MKQNYNNDDDEEEEDDENEISDDESSIINTKLSDKCVNIYNNCGDDDYDDEENDSSDDEEETEQGDDEEYDESIDKDNFTDNESTIESDEDIGTYDVNEEIRQLQLESDLPIEDLKASYFKNNNNEENDVNEEFNKTEIESNCEFGVGKEKNYIEKGEDEDLSIAKTITTTEVAKELDQEEKELNNIAATAQSLQPTGYTLETTNVKTKIPFLLKHSLREYQHVGLDWLVTMYENKLNGILADEMGLGKTIQTISLLAHLACEKGIWGPHLIVVPTSVMLNWELEFKKWCPAFKILTYYGNQKERRLKRQVNTF